MNASVALKKDSSRSSRSTSKDRPPGPKILIVTPEITSLPDELGPNARRFAAKAGGLADVSASLFRALHVQGARVHLAIPNFSTIFGFASAEESRQAVA